MNTKLVSSIEAVSRTRLRTAGSRTLIAEIANILSDTHISLVVICDLEGVMVGIITKTDIVQQIGHCQGAGCMSTAAELMIKDVTYCNPTDALPEVLGMMARQGFVHVPVVDECSRPLGVVNARDALKVLLAEEEYEESLLRDYVMGVGYR